ncbi:MAG TPA: helix-turn-helix domain-containing protein, partial [Bacilli bacterium]
VAVIKDMPDRKDRKFHPQHDKNLIGFSIKNICAQIVQEHGCGICFQDFNDDVVIVFNMEGWTANENMLKDVLNQCKENMDTFLHVDGFITVGTVENNFMDITKSYMRAKHLQEFSMIYPPKTVVFSNELSLPMRYSKDVLQTDISEIKVYLSRKDSQACFEFIDRIYSKLGTAAGVTPVYIQNTTLELIIQSTSALRSLKPNTDEFLEGFPDMITSVFELRNIQEMTVWLKDMLGRFIEFLKEEDQKMSPIVRKLVGYVDSHYAKDLNLTVIALDFHVNPTYLGQLFKQETGYTFSNYLNMVRIETAKGLLKTTHLKVYEVAKHVGYLYTNYFCSIFRKLTGTSPSEYVELNNH